MKTKQIAMMLILLLCMPGIVLAQTNWITLESNPIITQGGPGTWDGGIIFKCDVLLIDDTLRMYYTGGAVSYEPYYMSIGYAWSLDGEIWTKYSGNPVLEYQSTDWSADAIFNPAVHYDGSQYHMWFSGSDNHLDANIGYAWSDNGIHWTAHEDNPVLLPADTGWDTRSLWCGGVNHDGTRYELWYSGRSDADEPQVGRAYSTDGISWERDSLNPILGHGEEGDLDSYWLRVGGVLNDESGEYVFYDCSDSSGGNRNAITFAYSSDGINYEKSPVRANLVFGSYMPDVIRDPVWPVYHMYYAQNDDWHLEHAKSLLGYRDLWLDETYIVPGTGDAHISVRYEGEADLDIFAEIKEIEGTHEGSLQLYDDGTHGDGMAGDSLFANTYEMTGVEGQFMINMRAESAGDTIITYPNEELLTSVGPLVYDSHEQLFPYNDVIEPGDIVYFDVFINNQGSIGTACDVAVSISCTDTNTTLVGGGTGSFYPDISPGETLAPANHFGLRVNENTPIGTPIYFNMEISCTGYFISEETVLLIGYVSIDGEASTLPDHFMLEQNYPNPFNPTTSISYALPEQSTVKLTVFDIQGQEVIELRDETKPPGNYQVQWNGIDQQGNQVSTGVYFCRLEAGSFSQTIKMVLLR